MEMSGFTQNSYNNAAANGQEQLQQRDWSGAADGADSSGGSHYGGYYRSVSASAGTGIAGGNGSDMGGAVRGSGGVHFEDDNSAAAASGTASLRSSYSTVSTYNTGSESLQDIEAAAAGAAGKHSAMSNYLRISHNERALNDSKDGDMLEIFSDIGKLTDRLESRLQQRGSSSSSPAK
jgi:hypothetical protein